jgi:hypothetical protein
MYMTPEELAKEDPETLQKYMQMGDKSPLPLGAVKMALMMQDRLNMNAQAQRARAQGNGNPSRPTTIVDRIAEAVKQKIQSEPSPRQMAGIGAVPIPNVMQKQNFAGGGIVAFAGGDEVVGQGQVRKVDQETARASAEEDARVDAEIAARRGGKSQSLGASASQPSGASAAGSSLQEQLAERQRKLDERRKELGRVDPYTSEELSSMYGKEYSAAEERVKPFLDRMRALEESGRPDIPGMEQRSERAARQAMFSRMMQTRGAGFGAGIAGFGAALDEKRRQEERGLASIDAAKKAHVASQRLMVQAEMEATKGNSEAARRLVDAANAAKKTEVAENRNAHRELGREYDRANDIYEADKRAEQQAAATAQREAASQRQYEAMMAKIDATTKMALARMGGGGGGSSKGDPTYKLIEGTVARLYTNGNFMESATKDAQKAASAAGIDRKNPEYGAFVEKEVAARVARTAKQIAVEIPGGMLDTLPPSIKKSAPAPAPAPAPATPAPAASSPGVLKVDKLGNPR